MDTIGRLRIETAEYPFERFLSDIGGSFGIFLGISVATIVGFFEFVFNSFTQYIQHKVCVRVVTLKFPMHRLGRHGWFTDSYGI